MNFMHFILSKACDAFTKQRGFSDEKLYDSGNLYHSIEFAQYDYLQLGQYEKAQEMLSRMDSIISKLDGAKWNKTRDFIWIQQRMKARQKLETFGGCLKPEPESEHETVVPEDEFPITDGNMNYAAISELGLLLERLLQGIKMNSPCSEKMVDRALKQSKKLIKNLESRKSLFEYIKNTALMMHQLMTGIRDFAKNTKNTGALKKATDIQKQHMMQSSATPTLLYMPSYEVYGYVLLVRKEYEKALEMFEASLEERMGRTLSLLGLARAHSMLGDREQASYFYQYLQTQLQKAEEENLAVKEAENWRSSSKSRIAVEKIRDTWFWPYYLPFQLTDGGETKCSKANKKDEKTKRRKIPRWKSWEG